MKLTEPKVTTIPEATLRECARAHVVTFTDDQFLPTSAQLEEMRRLDALERRPIGRPHEL